MNRYLTWLIFFVAATVAVHGPARAQQPPEPPKAGENAVSENEYSFRLKGLDGKIYDSTEMGGDVLVVSFGATWCTPCAWELVAIEELKEEYKSRPVRFLWISIEDEARTSNALLRHYAKSKRLTIPVLRDADGRAFMQFSTTTRIPLVVFFDKQGRFVAPAQRGMSQDVTQYKQRVRARVDALLNEEAKRGAAATK